MNSTAGKWFGLTVFLFVVLSVGFTIGLTIRPGAWYQSLAKPFFTPPNWVFRPIWTLVYIFIAVAGWRVWLTEGIRSAAFGFWVVQMALNWTWTPMFFGAHWTVFGLFIILTLLGVSVAFMTSAKDRVAYLCFAPYIVWLLYASALNLAIVVLN